MHLLKTGPAKHLKNHAYDYKKKISAEIASIDRLQGMRQFLIAQFVVLCASVGFGVSTFLARLVYDRIYPPPVDPSLLALFNMTGDDMK